MLSYLMDEHVPHALTQALRRRQPALAVWRIGDAGAPARGALDPELLEWCEANGFVLVTNNRHSMPGHLADHLRRDRHIPGIFVLSSGMTMGETIARLLIAAEASFENEHQDQVRHLETL
jgi:hypothetical protein